MTDKCVSCCTEHGTAKQWQDVHLQGCTIQYHYKLQHPEGDVWLTDADVNQPTYYGLVSNVAGRTPDLVLVPQAGVVFASPGKKLSEHGGLMQSDLNVALMVYAPQLATAGTVYNSTVRLSPIPHSTGLPIAEARAAVVAVSVAHSVSTECHAVRQTVHHSSAPRVTETALQPSYVCSSCLMPGTPLA